MEKEWRKMDEGKKEGKWKRTRKKKEEVKRRDKKGRDKNRN